MRVFLMWASSAAWLYAGLGCGLAASGDCRPRSLAQLRASSPDGWAIYRQVGDPAFFASWIDCGDAQFDLSTAVHESTHWVTAETDAFPLVGGGALARPHEVSDFFPPYRIAGRFAPDDFTSIYLHEGKASSSTDVLYLLDEFNAYTHDLETAVDLRALSAPDQAVDHRDGLAAMMAFLAAYAEEAEASEPATWDGLRRPRAKATIAALWAGAERVMARSCGIPNFGTSDRSYLARVCAADGRSALGQILGRAPTCPRACLEPMPAPEHAGDEAAETAADTSLDETATSSLEPARPHHPFAAAAGPRRHRPSAAD